ncbi:hypothetical protein CON65_12765 [Bacillus pseudomycoides]|uniref:Uncharacterized protein n=1 Tax=Bacillus pseudomycoides TaxID=64104 RepID=A0AA91VCX1_9BACI|nr:hypothetical protein COO03_13200 [Bacillus sp. AFS098217]PED82293.1 hypothetical protein CON65_12765 [Bacillus pseudomycoides]
MFRHLHSCYAEQKVTDTRLLILFLLRMWQKRALTASMHGQMLSPTEKEGDMSFFKLMYI